MLASLREHQVLANVASWPPLSRRAGPGTRGLFTFAVVFLMEDRSWGILPFALQFGTALARLVIGSARGPCGWAHRASDGGIHGPCARKSHARGRSRLPGPAARRRERVPTRPALRRLGKPTLRGFAPRSGTTTRLQRRARHRMKARFTSRTADRPNIPKQLARDIKSEVKARVAQLLKDLRRIGKPKELRTGIERRRDPLLASGKTVIPATRPFLAPLPDSIAGHLLPDSRVFLPAQARARARSLLTGLTLPVATTLRPGQAPRQH